MRVSSTSEVPRVDLATVRRLVPALWAEWSALEFTSDGWLRDPDSAQPLPIVRLTHGRHRMPGAEYTIHNGDAHVGFVLTSDDRRTVRGTLSGRWWHADLEINDRVGAVGSIDVASVLRANDVPGWLVPLIGGRAASGELQVEPVTLERSGDLVSGQAQAQRARVDLTGHVKADRRVWRGRITVHVNGRGVLGRLALLVLRSTVRRELRQALVEFWADTEREVAGLQRDLVTLEADIAAAGNANAWLHRELWAALREPATRTEDPESGPAAADSRISTGDLDSWPAGSTTRKRRRYEAPLAIPITQDEAARVAYHDQASDQTELIVRRKGQRVRATWPSHNRHDNPPRFVGEIRQQLDGLVLTGSIRESLAHSLWVPLYGLVTLLMLVVAVVGVVGVAAIGVPGLAPLLVGVIGTSSFALLLRAARRSRGPEFDDDARVLRDGLARYVTSGDGRRGSL